MPFRLHISVMPCTHAHSPKPVSRRPNHATTSLSAKELPERQHGQCRPYQDADEDGQREYDDDAEAEDEDLEAFPALAVIEPRHAVKTETKGELMNQWNRAY